MLRSGLTAVAVITIATLAPTGAAFADAARATTNLNVRSGPGTGYAVVDSLSPGEVIDARECSSGWCQVGQDGWVSARYLAFDAPQRSEPSIIISPRLLPDYDYAPIIRPVPNPCPYYWSCLADPVYFSARAAHIEPRTRPATS